MGEFVRHGGETWYAISSPQKMRPFLVSLASDNDLWMFVTSRGGLTCGRRDADGALFPYLTVDRLHDAHLHTGPVTLLRIRDGNRELLWEPFAPTGDYDADLERRLLKNAAGNRLAWEEHHAVLGLTIHAEWAPSARYGWVRTVTLTNQGSAPVALDVLDGWRNILPWGVPLGLYQQASNLVDAYRFAEIDPDSGLGIFALTAGITDRAEAVEVLRANAVWCDGVEHPRLHLDAGCLERFRSGSVLTADTVLRGGRGGFFADFSLVVEPGRPFRWRLAGDVGLDHADLAELRALVRSGNGGEVVAEDLKRSEQALRRLVASADGLQMTSDAGAVVHHYANTLFNIMRGGVFTSGHDVARDDFEAFLEERHRSLAARHKEFLDGLPATTDCTTLFRKAEKTGDPDLQRLVLEYLPLQFSRRHGDPSRPWNAFSVRVRDDDGRPLLHYEGNWRDIFQNWEALGYSFPRFFPHMVARFLNASTVDGFNPYRLNREGLEWEIVEPGDPWANIGYWGDHQIVYLTRLLEAWDRHEPGALVDFMSREIFSYAAVPYRLRGFREILADPAHSILFDEERHEAVMRRAEAEGGDGKLLHDGLGRVVHAAMLEKLLVPVLAKLSNLVPDGGIWMNTQRPEWNDANNALAGWGLSVVTLAHLRRHLAFLIGVLERDPARSCPVATEVATWLDSVAAALGGLPPVRDEAARGRFLEQAGEAFAAYRESVYQGGFHGERTALQTGDVAAFLRSALVEVDRSLAANRRADGLYHAYNILAPRDGGGKLGITRLQEMLEGQVAVLGAGILGEQDTLTLLRSLFASDLYRPDQHSFVLYPRRELPGFLERNRIPEAAAESVKLLQRDLKDGGGRLVVRDADGVLRFAPGLQRDEDLEAALAELAALPDWAHRVQRDGQAVRDLYEEVFHHRSFTGRSGAMYGYEGLGCIYWHMVAKLLLAVQESVTRARSEHWSAASVRELEGMYGRIRDGLGYRKTVAEFGAFPMDPYSHTPDDGGARQPGMTGQVKEEILTRLGELGVTVADGAVTFTPTLLERREFLGEEETFRFFGHDGEAQALALQPGELAFTLCQTPVVYRLEKEGPATVVVTFADGGTRIIHGACLGPGLSGEIFGRTGRIAVIRVMVSESALDDG